MRGVYFVVVGDELSIVDARTQALRICVFRLTLQHSITPGTQHSSLCSALDAVFGGRHRRRSGARYHNTLHHSTANLASILQQERADTEYPVILQRT